jgi:hypothetical protein
VPNRASGAFDPKWGFGLVDAATLATTLTPVAGGQPAPGGG